MPENKEILTEELQIKLENLKQYIARIEVPPADISRLAADEIREAVYEKFREIGFLFVTLDLKGYRLGSMNATLK